MFLITKWLKQLNPYELDFTFRHEIAGNDYIVYSIQFIQRPFYTTYKMLRENLSLLLYMWSVCSVWIAWIYSWIIIFSYSCYDMPRVFAYIHCIHSCICLCLIRGNSVDIAHNQTQYVLYECMKKRAKRSSKQWMLSSFFSIKKVVRNAYFHYSSWSFMENIWFQNFIDHASDFHVYTWKPIFIDWESQWIHTQNHQFY